MSLENEIKELRTTIQVLTDAITANPLGATPSPAEVKPEPKKAQAKTKKAAPVKEEPADEEVNHTQAPNEASDEEANAPTAPAPTYEDDVKPAVLAAAKDNRQAVIDALESFDVKKATELDESQYPAFLARLNELLEA